MNSDIVLFCIIRINIYIIYFEIYRYKFKESYEKNQPNNLSINEKLDFDHKNEIDIKFDSADIIFNSGLVEIKNRKYQHHEI